MRIRVFEAFSGYGSQSIALRNLGINYEVVAISEIDKYALKAYESIHGEVNNLGDISKIDIKDVPEHDLFTYSFPCQDISIAGKQMSLEENSGTRSSLLWECKKVIESCKPKYLLMENVKNLVEKKHRPHFDKWLEYLEMLGYTNYWKILNAKDYGVPQNRERVFVVSILGKHNSYEFPKGFKLTKCIKDILEDNVDEKYYMTDKCIEKMKRFAPKNLNKSKYLLEGVAPTITTELCHHTGKNVSPKLCIAMEEYRRITPKETFRLMGLNDDDIAKIQSCNISDTQQYKMAGNSIVVQVLEKIFKNLFLK